MPLLIPDGQPQDSFDLAVHPAISTAPLPTKTRILRQIVVYVSQLADRPFLKKHDFRRMRGAYLKKDSLRKIMRETGSACNMSASVSVRPESISQRISTSSTPSPAV